MPDPSKKEFQSPFEDYLLSDKSPAAWAAAGAAAFQSPFEDYLLSDRIFAVLSFDHS